MNKSSEGKPTRRTILNDYVREKSQGVKPVQLVDTVEYQEKVYKIYECIKDGMASREIYATMLVEDSQLGEQQFAAMLRHAFDVAENSLQKDREYVFKLHMERYEDMYFKSMKMEDMWGKPLDHRANREHWPIMVAKLSNALKIMRSKEDLLGLHDKKVVLEFNDQKALVVDNDSDQGLKGEVPGYDLDELSLEEQLELLRLIQQTRTVPIEGIQRVVVKQLKIEINTETGERLQSMVTKNIDDVKDITFEEMPPNVLAETKTIVREEEYVEPEGDIFIDQKPNIRGRELSEVAGDINQRQLEKFRAKLKSRRHSR